MKININGLRTGLTADCNALKSELEYFFEQVETYSGMPSKQDVADLKDKFDEVARGIGFLNLVYDDEIEGDFDDLSQQIQAKRFEQEEKNDSD
jgi:shikimate 5-dehydrogenase